MPKSSLGGARGAGASACSASRQPAGGCVAGLGCGGQAFRMKRRSRAVPFAPPRASPGEDHHLSDAPGSKAARRRHGELHHITGADRMVLSRGQYEDGAAPGVHHRRPHAFVVCRNGRVRAKEAGVSSTASMTRQPFCQGSAGSAVPGHLFAAAALLNGAGPLDVSWLDLPGVRSLESEGDWIDLREHRTLRVQHGQVRQDVW